MTSLVDFHLGFKNQIAIRILKHLKIVLNSCGIKHCFSKERQMGKNYLLLTIEETTDIHQRYLVQADTVRFWVAP